MKLHRTLAIFFTLAAALVAQPLAAATKDSEIAGYMIVETESAPKKDNAGSSIYVAAWRLLNHYPGHRFQTGLYGTWMFQKQEGEPPKDMHSDIEGGLGWWRDTRFPTETPKFIMGGVAPNHQDDPAPSVCPLLAKSIAACSFASTRSLR